jgi:hypothetical protein
VRFSFHARRGLLRQLRDLQHPVAQLLTVAALPLGTALYLVDLVRAR